MKRHYLVKIKHNGKTIFGVCDSYSKQAKEAHSKGNLLVEDAVLPDIYEVSEEHVVEFDASLTQADYLAAHERSLNNWS